MTMQEDKAPPLSGSEEIRSGWVFERPKILTGSRRAGGPAATGPRPPLSPGRASIVVTTGTVAVLAVWFVLYALVFSGFQESHAQHVNYTRLRAYLGSQRVPFGGVIAPGTPIALMNAPSINLRSVAVEGTSSKDLQAGPGHFPTSPFPGQVGTSVFYGRSATYGSPFGSIGSLKVGQSIYMTTGQGVFRYDVTDIRHAGDPQPPVLTTTQSRLTLVTSEGSGWRSGWAPTQVMYVDASFAGKKLQPAPAGRPTAVRPTDQALASDTSHLVPLVLWLQAMLMLAAGLVYAHSKWTIWQLWLVAVPVVVAVLWGVTSTTMLLLPNLA